MREFVKELRQEVAQSTGDWDGSSGYLDADEPVGSRWDERIVEELTACQVFVPLLSPSYVKSEYCGKELGFFLQRLDRQAGEGKRPPLIVPILWERFSETFPCLEPYGLDVLQLHNAGLPEIYPEKGLRRLMKRFGEHKEQLDHVIEALADRVVEAGRSHRLERWTDEVTIDDLPSVFAGSAAGAPAPAAAPIEVRPGPRRVRLIAAACDRVEAAGIGRDVSRYGAAAEEWSPFDPEQPETLTYYAQGVAYRYGLTSTPTPASADLDKVVEEARDTNEIVAVLVDGWAAEVDRYVEMLEKYDKGNKINACTLVPWNVVTDEQTAGRYEELRQKVRSALAASCVAGDEQSYQDNLRSLSEFEEALGRMLPAAQQRVIRYGEVRRRPDGPSSPPRLTGPVGR